ncbi:ABC transporter C family member 10-like [Impatiens glandulifera]|uniref:ABC transporter C family member 10-like n=1 Tax=Impatiens glandulifera TaxID=253017 RepID=UPI001FB0A6FF|nr:ABC transporter C family member 10-like [Impatiens glandulifera]
MGGLWSQESCVFDVENLMDLSTCANHTILLCFDLFLIIIFFLFLLIHKTSSKSVNYYNKITHFHGFSSWQIASASYNSALGLSYLCFSLWLKNTTSLHEWLPVLLHGAIWLSIGLSLSLKGRSFLGSSSIWILSTLIFIFSGFVFGLSLFAATLIEHFSLKITLDLLFLPGAALLLICTFKCHKHEEIENYDILSNGETTQNDDVGSFSFSGSGFFSKMTFWWLNPLMRKGREKTIEEEDIPKLREQDKADICYLLFIEQLRKQKRGSILMAIVSCFWKEILVSGFFAFLKIITLSSGPLLLNSFIKVAEGKQSFEHEGYFLAITLFFAKILESLSQRQWYFRTRLIGMKVRSLLTAAIYKKQLRLSNSAKKMHSAGEIMNYVTVDAYRIGEFPFWFHQIWTTSLQLCLALIILYNAIGLATIASLSVILITVGCNAPMAKLQHGYQSKLMSAQDERLKASSEALVNMKVLKLYAWGSHFKRVIEKLREVEYKWLSAVQIHKSYNLFIFWSSPVLVSAATFGSCYLLHVPLNASNVFTFVATLRIVQDPITLIPDVIGVVIQAKVAFARIVKFLEESELGNENCCRNKVGGEEFSVFIKADSISWETVALKPTLRNVDLEVRPGEKVAICGEVGSGKSTLLAAILGEVSNVQGSVQVHGSIAYVSQSAWIQTGTIKENIIFGSSFDSQRYQETLETCSLMKDLELLDYGDLTEIGERGVNLSGGQKQRIQLARSLYQNADVYLLDDPFSAVDAHTASSLFNEYVIKALSKKTVLLVTHQVDFLPAFDSVILMSDGEIQHAAPYNQLLASSKEFKDLVNAHKETAGSERPADTIKNKVAGSGKEEISELKMKLSSGVEEQLIKREEREVGDTGLRPYLIYLNQNKGYLFFFIGVLCHLTFVIGQILQNLWMASNVENPNVTIPWLISVYLFIGITSTVFVFIRCISNVYLGMRSSKSLFSRLLNSLFRAPMSFYDSTPLGRILSRVSSDLSIIDLDLPFSYSLSVYATINAYSNLIVLASITWQVLFVSVPMIYIAIRLQKYYYSSAKELMQINGTTKSVVANHLSESIAGAMTIRAFKEEERFFAKNLQLIDMNASPFFHSFAANEWLIQRLEILSATVLSASALCLALLPRGTFTSGMIGMALSYGLSLNMSLIFSIQLQCTLANYIVSIERLNQYMYIPSEASEIVEEARPPLNWPSVGKVEIQDLQIRYRTDAPLVLRGISCTFKGGHKIGIVGRTGSGKTTLIGALFRLVEPVGGKIIVDGIDITTIGLNDLRSRVGIIPQDPTLFTGTVRYNLDPMSQHTDHEIWEVLGKCQLEEVVHEKEHGLDSLVVEDGSNWSMGQRQLFCLGRALLRKSKILVLDEATASIDNAIDLILQKTIRTEFAECTVITVAHRIPTVMDCTMVLAMSDGKVVEFDEPIKLMNNEDSLFGKLVKEYWSHYHSADSH